MIVGRPTDYTEELADKICEVIATHTQGLRKLKKMYDWFPDDTTIAKWRLKYEYFSRKYLEAKRLQIDLIVESLDEKLDDSLGYYTDERGNERIDSPSTQIAIAKANNAKWYASKIAPKIYGTQPFQVSVEETSTSVETLRKIMKDIERQNESDV